MCNFFLSLALGLMVIFSPCFANSQDKHGGISLSQTRLVFFARDNSLALRVNNESERNWLVQSRVLASVEGSDATFIVTPPLSKIKSQSSQLLRVLPQNNTLPTDRESLFYLSVTAIPSQPTPILADGKLSVGVRFVLKLFYRPDELSLSPDDAPCRLVMNSDTQGVRIRNPTPYFQTLGTLSINGQSVSIEEQYSMIGPQSSLTIPWHASVHNITWQTVTDYGGLSAQCSQIR